MPPSLYVKIHSLRTVERFADHCRSLGLDLPCDSQVLRAPESPLSFPLPVPESEFVIGNRIAAQPMEGWDGTLDGFPTERTRRRWRRFGESGAKLIWGGEAVSVIPDGRANPNQLMLHQPEHKAGIAQLRETLLQAHRDRFDSTDGLLLGLQLTHSGRFCRPVDKTRLKPVILYRHPLLDRKFGLPDDYPLMTDGDIRALIEEYVRAAKWARDIGFHFVDLKHCHGYLGHEFLSATTRDGDYGGSLANRTRFLRETVQAIRSAAPGLMIGVRVSAFDFVPFQPDSGRSEPGKPGPGVPVDYSGCMPYRFAFGANPDRPTEIDFAEIYELFEIFESLDIRLVNVTAGSPYYNPHIQRPALYPPSDGYAPPEDPLVGAVRQIETVRKIKAKFPNILIVGTGYTYLQEFLPHAAQAIVREGWTDSVGVGRLLLSYPGMLADALSGEAFEKKRICRTFSDCTTAPRNGLVSGCYPLDEEYKSSPEAETLAKAKYQDR